MKYYYSFILTSLLITYSFGGFLVKPYFQPGVNPFENGQEQRTLIFEMEPEDKDIKVILTDSKNRERELKLNSDISRFNSLIYNVLFTNLEFDMTYLYKVIQKDKPIFENNFKISSKYSPLELIIFGCAGENTKEQKQIANLIKIRTVDNIIYLGDFTYTKKVNNKEVRAGTATAFRQNFFKPYEGIFSKVPFYSVIGNKEIDSCNFNEDEDAYAYFDYVCHPLNGPETLPIDTLKGKSEKVQNFLFKIPHFKRASNYSVDFYKEGKALVHLQVVDGNAWMDPSQESLQSWMAEDLKSTKAPWKIACIHQPLASCLQKVTTWNRLISLIKLFMPEKANKIKNKVNNEIIPDRNRVCQYAKIWQENGVQLVLNAHLHGYDRSNPLKIHENFQQSREKFQETIGQGPIYITTGAAGAHLHIPAYASFMSYVFEKMFLDSGYTAKASLRDYSFSSLKIDSKKLILEQIDKSGSIIDNFQINL